MSCYIDDRGYSLSETMGTDTQNYELPDKRIISISKDAMMSPSLLFDDGYLHTANAGIGSYGGFRAGDSYYSVIDDIINTMNHEHKADMWANRVLAGGGSMMRGISDRFKVELSKKTTRKIKIITQPERLSSAWIGGSVVGTLSTFDFECITQQEYIELGTNQLLAKSSY